MVGCFEVLAGREQSQRRDLEGEEAAERLAVFCPASVIVMVATHGTVR